jgi:hypothetical protein
MKDCSLVFAISCSPIFSGAIFTADVGLIYYYTQARETRKKQSGGNEGREADELLACNSMLLSAPT